MKLCSVVCLQLLIRAPNELLFKWQMTSLALHHLQALVWYFTFDVFLCPAVSACREPRAFGLFVRMYLCTSEDQVKIFGQGKISRPINDNKLIFHMRIYLYETSRNIQEPWPHDQCISWSTDFGLGQFIKVKIFVQSRISRSINGSKSMFNMRMYLYEASRNIQEPWAPDLYFMNCWLHN